MPAENNFFFGSESDSGIPVPGEANWEMAISYAQGLADFIEEEGLEGSLDPDYLDAVVQLAEDPEQLVDEVFRLGVELSNRRIKKMGRFRMPEREILKYERQWEDIYPTARPKSNRVVKLGHLCSLWLIENLDRIIYRNNNGK